MGNKISRFRIMAKNTHTLFGKRKKKKKKERIQPGSDTPFFLGKKRKFQESPNTGGFFSASSGFNGLQ